MRPRPFRARSAAATAAYVSRIATHHEQVVAVLSTEVARQRAVLASTTGEWPPDIAAHMAVTLVCRLDDVSADEKRARRPARAGDDAAARRTRG